MKKIIIALFTFTLIINPSIAADKLPITLVSGQLKQLQPGDDLKTESGINAEVVAPSYTSGDYHSYHVFNLNNLDYEAEYAAEQAGLAATDALTSALKITSGTIHQTNAIAAYLDSSRAKPVTNGGDVAGYFHAKASGTDANVFGINSLASDTVGFTGQTLQNEIDINVNSISTSVQGLGLVLNSSVAISAGPLGYVCRIASTTEWGACYYTTDGATDLAFRVGALGTGNNVNSQEVQFISRSSGGTTYTSTIRGDTSGSLVLRPGVAAGAVAFQNTTADNYGYINADGFNTSSYTANSAVDAGLTALTMTNTSAASVTSKAVSQLFKGYDTVSAVKTAVQVSAVPVDVNWVDAYLSFSARKSDTVTEVARIDGNGITALAGVKLKVTTIGALPTCDAGAAGYTYAVNDALAPSYNATLTAGGAAYAIASCNGTNWTAH